MATAEELASLLRGPVPRRRVLEVQARAFRLGALSSDLLATRLIGHHPPRLAPRLLALLPRPGLFPFNAALRVLAPRHPSAALSAFSALLRRSPSPPSPLSFSFLLQAALPSPALLRQAHAQILARGLARDPALAGALLRAYSLRHLPSARRLFTQTRGAVSVPAWASLIRALARADRPDEALSLFFSMRARRLSPDDDTAVAALSACAKTTRPARWLAALGPPGLDNATDAALVYLRAKVGDADGSRAVFEKAVRERGAAGTGVALWNCAISGCVQRGEYGEALALFRRLVASPGNPRPNRVTAAGLLPACAWLGDLELGRAVHRAVGPAAGRGNPILGTAVVDMYCKCGSPGEGWRVFREMENRDVVAVNAMMAGLAVNGMGREALGLLREMPRLGLRPNGESFLAALAGCSHAGLVEEGCRVVGEMAAPPGPELQACLVDLLARAGLVGEAAAAAAAASEPREELWGALIGAYLAAPGEEAARAVAAVGAGRSAAAHVMLANAAAAGGRWVEVAGVRAMMAERGLKKQPGCSWITLDGATREFRIGCLKTTAGMEQLPAVLESLHLQMAGWEW
ncbi:pentatricopeptide repeat-containing protein At2g34400-like [Wolffia australiana]